MTVISSRSMDRIKRWVPHLGFAAVMAGALLSRDACFGGAKRPPPEPVPQQTAAPASAEPASPPSSAAPAPTGTFAAPP